MESKRKSNSVITTEFDGVSIIKFLVQTEKMAAPMVFEFDMAKAGTAHQLHAAMHGYVQKISDRAAIGRDPETGLSATPEEKFAAMRETAQRLESGGPWNSVAAGGSGNAGGVLYRAMRAVYPNTWDNREAFSEWLKGQAVKESERLKKSVSVADVQKAFLSIKKIAKEIERMRQEEGKATGIVAADLLQELETAPKA